MKAKLWNLTFQHKNKQYYSDTFTQTVNARNIQEAIRKAQSKDYRITSAVLIGEED